MSSMLHVLAPPGTPLYKRTGVRARNLENDRYKIIKGAEVLSVWEWQQLGRTGTGRKGRPEGVFRSVMKTPSYG